MKRIIYKCVPTCFLGNAVGRLHLEKIVGMMVMLCILLCTATLRVGAEDIPSLSEEQTAGEGYASALSGLLFLQNSLTGTQLQAQLDYESKEAHVYIPSNVTRLYLYGSFKEDACMYSARITYQSQASANAGTNLRRYLSTTGGYIAFNTAASTGTPLKSNTLEGAVMNMELSSDLGRETWKIRLHRSPVLEEITGSSQQETIKKINITQGKFTYETSIYDADMVTLNITPDQKLSEEGKAQVLINHEAASFQEKEGCYQGSVSLEGRYTRITVAVSYPGAYDSGEGVYDLLIERIRRNDIQNLGIDSQVVDLTGGNPTTQVKAIISASYDIASPRLVWSVENPEIASVSYDPEHAETAVLTGVKDGLTTFTVTDGYVSASGTLRVEINTPVSVLEKIQVENSPVESVLDPEKKQATIENATFPGESIMPGTTAKVTFDGLYRSVNKISGIFNPTVLNLRYTVDGKEISGSVAQYQQMDTAAVMVNIPADISFAEGESSTSIKASNGYVYGSMYSAANPFGAMYSMTDTGVGTNFNAVTVAYAYQKMADIEIPVVKMPSTAVTLHVTNCENAAIVLTDAAGNEQTPENGVYTLAYGTYKYAVTAEGFIKEVGKFSVTSADEGSKVVNITLRAKDTATWDGTSKTAVTPNEEGIYEIRTGAELAWFADQVNAGTGEKYQAKLMNNISLNNELWTPIGNNSKKYSGVFNGNGYWITDLYCNGKNYQGLFGYVTAATIKNLGVAGEVIGSSTYVGGILGYGISTTVVDCCVNKCDVTTSNSGTGNIYLGGVCGALAQTGTIRNSMNLGTITGCGKFGGLCGANMNCKLENCVNIGTVNNTSTVANVLKTTDALTCAGTATNSYYLDGCCNGTSAKGTRKTSEELKTIAPALGEAFVSDNDNINNGYPVLFWQDTASMNAVSAVEALIEAIPQPVTISSKTAVDAANSAYDNLGTQYLKSFVGNYAVLTAAINDIAVAEGEVKAVEDLIDAIGTPVYYSSKPAVEAARSAYHC